MASENISRLPLWAQERIRVAEMRQAEAEAKMSELFGKQGTDTFMRDGICPERPLLRGATIGFQIDNYRRIDAQLRQGRVNIYGTGRIKIHPFAANAVDIEAE